MHDLIIIGSGPAGLTAAIYAARYTLSTLVIGSSPGGQVVESGRIENYPGFKRVMGSELTQKMLEQVEGFGVEVVREEVSGIEYLVFGIKGERKFKISTATGKVYEAWSVILAIGVEPRKLGIPGEERLLGKGVSYCALCDAPFFKDKVVAMVGGGDSAVDGALELSGHAKRIYLINRSGQFRAKPDFVEKAKASPKIEIVQNTNVVQINGQNLVESVVLDSLYQGQNKLAVDGIFIEVGNVPDPELPASLGLKVDEHGYMEVAEDMSTNVEGVFAAGDITTGSNGMKQIVTACAEGAIAAQSVYRYPPEGKNLPVSQSPSFQGLTEEKRQALGDFPEPASGELAGLSPSRFTNSKKKLVIDKDLCIGCGLCTAVAENTFELSGDGKAAVKNPSGDSEEKIQEAIDSCPVSAIGGG